MKIPETHPRIEHKATESPNTDLGPFQNWNHIHLVTVTL